MRTGSDGLCEPLLHDRGMRPPQEGLLQLQEPLLPDLRQEGHRSVDTEAKGDAAANAMATHHADDAISGAAIIATAAMSHITACLIPMGVWCDPVRNQF